MQASELIDDIYLDQVFKYLEKIKPGSIIEVTIIAPNKPALFIECVKKYIDLYPDIDFNEDYTKIRKLQNDKEFKNYR